MRLLPHPSVNWICWSFLTYHNLLYMICRGLCHNYVFFKRRVDPFKSQNSCLIERSFVWSVWQWMDDEKIFAFISSKRTRLRIQNPINYNRAQVKSGNRKWTPKAALIATGRHLKTYKNRPYYIPKLFHSNSLELDMRDGSFHVGHYTLSPFIPKRFFSFVFPVE